MNPGLVACLLVVTIAGLHPEVVSLIRMNVLECGSHHVFCVELDVFYLRC